jgi:hypothetical protein
MAGFNRLGRHRIDFRWRVRGKWRAVATASDLNAGRPAERQFHDAFATPEVQRA